MADTFVTQLIIIMLYDKIRFYVDISFSNSFVYAIDKKSQLTLRLKFKQNNSDQVLIIVNLNKESISKAPWETDLYRTTKHHNFIEQQSITNTKKNKASQINLNNKASQIIQQKSITNT